MSIAKRLLLLNIGIVCLNVGMVYHYVKPSFQEASQLFPEIVAQPQYQQQYIPTRFLTDSSGDFTIVPFMWPSRTWDIPRNGSSVFLATHTSPDRLFWVFYLSAAWNGHISVTVFVPGKEARVAEAMIEFLHHCYPLIKDRCSFHSVYPKQSPPVMNGNGSYHSLFNCEDPEGTNKNLMFLQESYEPSHVKYPQNLLRNIARRACPSTHTLVVDVDMIPSADSSPRLETFLRSLNSSLNQSLFIIPVYEVEDAQYFPPKTKQQLLDMLKEKKAQIYHHQVFEKNQRNTNLSHWEAALGEDDGVRISYAVTTYEEYWEPIVVLPVSAPDFEERFIGYGYTRNSHIYHLHLLRYTFYVLDNCFLAHRGFQTTKGYPEFRRLQIQLNLQRYKTYIKELQLRYMTPKAKPKKKVHSIKRIRRKA